MSIGVLNCIHKPSVGDLDACRAWQVPVADAINGSDRLGDSLKCSTTIITSREHADQHFFAYDKVRGLIGAAFPFLWVSISYDPARVSRDFFDPLLERYGLVPFTEGQAAGVFQKP